jgi:Ca-activated chloride channel family protein
MRLRNALGLAACGMMLSSFAAFALPVPSTTSQALAPESDVPAVAIEEAPPSHFSAGSTLMIDARLGHPALVQNGSGETFVFASVTGGEATAAPPVRLGIVIDRSGSMRGERFARALDAATGILERMRDGDEVSIVTFDTNATTVVPPTRIDAATRAGALAALRRVTLGGDTCISCGLEEAMRGFERFSGESRERTRETRLILLSDGATNHGIRDLPGLRSLAAQIRDRGAAVTTIGVDVDYDEKVMAALALESNGRHAFVANAADLPRVFAEEFDTMLSAVARDSELRVDLEPGVVVEQVFDRTFRRDARGVVIPLGTFSEHQEKTVLMKVRVPTALAGRRDVARLSLAYADLVTNRDAGCEGRLALDVGTSGDAPIDPFVAARLARSETSCTLGEVNRLFEAGRVDEARKRLAAQSGLLRQTRELAERAAPAPRKALGRNFTDDLDEQSKVVASAEAAFAAPPPRPATLGASGIGASPAGDARGRAAPGALPPAANAAPSTASREGKAAVRSNQQAAVDLAF